MSAMGNSGAQSMQQLQQQLRDTVQELEEFKRAVRESSSTSKEEARARRDSLGAMLGDQLGFVGNWAAKAGTRAARNAAMQAGEDVIAHGDLLSGASLLGNTMNGVLGAFSRLPIAGALTSDITAAKDEVSARLSAVAGMVGRAGGEMSDQTIGTMAGIWGKQASGAQREIRRVQEYMNQPSVIWEFAKRSRAAEISEGGAQAAMDGLAAANRAAEQFAERLEKLIAMLDRWVK